MSDSTPPNPTAAAVERLLGLTGLSQADVLGSPPRCGGFRVVSREDGSASIIWHLSPLLSDVLEDVEASSRQPDHPLVQFEGQTFRIMMRTMAEILLDSGYTVTLLPGLDDDPADIFLRVTGGPGGPESNRNY